MKGKILVLSLVVATLSIICPQVTLAFLMDTDDTVATFTTGQVKVQTLTASIGRNSVNTATMAVTTNADDTIIASAGNYAVYAADNCTNMQGGDVCSENVFVRNTGTASAYVRVRILVPKTLVDGDSPEITLNMTTADEYTINERVENGADYEYVFIRKQPLAVGQMVTEPVLKTITYNTYQSAGGEGDGEFSAETLNLSAQNIRVRTEAIQAKGFANVTEAFAHFN